MKTNENLMAPATDQKMCKLTIHLTSFEKTYWARWEHWTLHEFLRRAIYYLGRHFGRFDPEPFKVGTKVDASLGEKIDTKATITVSEDLMFQVEKLCKYYDMSKSEVCRMAGVYYNMALEEVFF